MTGRLKGKKTGMLASRAGMALVLTLMVLAIITALVVEFAYGVYVQTTLLYNWQSAQNLSLVASSGASLAAKFVTANIGRQSYTYPGTITLPSEDPFKDGTLVSLLLEDENAKFNLNTLVLQNGRYNEDAGNAFRRLLAALSLKEDLADLMVDWIDRDNIPRPAGLEDGTRNSPMDSVGELLLIPGVGRKVYDKLLPYVTVFGEESFGKARININGATVPVLMSLSDLVTREMAQRVVDYRDTNGPFTKKGELQKVAGFEDLYVKISDGITVKGVAFRIEVTASRDDGLSRVIQCVIDTAGIVKYWREI